MTCHFPFSFETHLISNLNHYEGVWQLNFFTITKGKIYHIFSHNSLFFYNKQIIIQFTNFTTFGDLKLFFPFIFEDGSRHSFFFVRYKNQFFFIIIGDSSELVNSYIIFNACSMLAEFITRLVPMNELSNHSMQKVFFSDHVSDSVKPFMLSKLNHYRGIEACF